MMTIGSAGGCRSDTGLITSTAGSSRFARRMSTFERFRIRKSARNKSSTAAGHSQLTSVGVELRRDTTNRGLLPAKGTTTTLGLESFGLLGRQL